MFRFNKVNNNLYRYRDINVKIQFDEYDNTSMLAEFTEGSGESVQFYSYGFEFEKVKQTIINKINKHLEKQSNGRS